MKNILKMAICSLLFIACTQDDFTKESEVENVNKIHSIDDSMLVFESEDQLKEFVANKIESNTDLLEEARTEFDENGRLSLLVIYNSLEKEEAERLNLNREQIAKVDSPDSMLLYLLNANGELQIEDKIFRIDGDFVYSYTSGSGENINEFTEAYLSVEIRIEDQATPAQLEAKALREKVIGV